MDTMNHVYRALAETMVNHGVVKLPLQISGDVGIATKCFKLFLEESRKYREMWNFWGLKDGESVLDVGYKERGNAPGEDAKHLFHWSPDLVELLQERKVDISRHRKLLRSCQASSYWCMGVFVNLGKALDVVMPGYHLYERVSHRANWRQVILRLGQYKEVSGRRVIGKGHTDKSFLTIHLCDSHPGLHFAGGDPIRTRNQILVFPGDKMEQVTKGEMKAVWHEVTDERSAEDRTPRSFSVFFSNISY